ncbi:MAG: DPP IV N-terminal domain-containing protein, partial [Longimicrobiales bacterium]
MFRSHRTRFVLSLIALASIPPEPSPAQSTATLEPEPATRFEFSLTIRSIMRGPELVGQAPSGIQWSDDSRWIYFRWLPGGRAWSDTREMFRVPARGGEPERVDDDALEDLAITFARGALSPDRKYRLSSLEGDLYLVERENLRVTRLTETQEVESAVGFRADGKAVFFTRSGNLFERNLEGSLVRQLTDIREGSPPRDPEEAKGQKGFLQDQQQKLFEHIRRLKAEEAEREADRDKAREGEPEPLYVPRGERVQGLQPSPDGAFVALTAYRPAEEAQRVMIPSWITESGYTEDLTVRTKVGDANGSSRVGIMEVATGNTTWLDLYPADDDPAKEAGEDRGSGSEDPDLSRAAFIGWNDAGTIGLLTSVSYDNKNRWLFTVDAATGDLTLLDALHDEAWVGGPCSFGCVGWLPGSDRVYFGSEETGYAHIYTIDADGTGKQALTSGEWEVLGLEMSEDRSFFILHTNEGSPFNQHVYTMRFDGSRKRAITSGPGSYEVTVSPDGRRMAVVHSKANRPPELFVANFEAGAEADQVTFSPTAEWLTLPWIQPEIIH